jgi:hypothetical protein
MPTSFDSLINKNPTVSGIVVGLIAIGIGTGSILVDVSGKNENARLREICTIFGGKLI